MEIRTPHIVAEEGAFAQTVLMPGDPLRAKFIANTYLENAQEIQNIRGMLAYSGNYKGKKVSIMGSGMGIPSMGIYSHELYKFFGVENIIRIGTAGSISDKIKVRDIIIAMGACTDSNYISQFGLNGDFSIIADFKLLQNAVEVANNMGHKANVGNILSTEIFYHESADEYKKWAKLGVTAVEMETAALYINAAKLGKRALTICTVSDEIFTGVECTAEERQSSFSGMVDIALETALLQDN